MPTLTPAGRNDQDAKMWTNVVQSVPAGQFFVVDARGMTTLTVITTATGTATISRVDSDTAGADSADTAGNATCATGTRTTVVVDWPFYRIGAATTACRVACV